MDPVGQEKTIEICNATLYFHLDQYAKTLRHILPDRGFYVHFCENKYIVGDTMKGACVFTSIASAMDLMKEIADANPIFNTPAWVIIDIGCGGKTISPVDKLSSQFSHL